MKRFIWLLMIVLMLSVCGCRPEEAEFTENAGDVLIQVPSNDDAEVSDPTEEEKAPAAENAQAESEAPTEEEKQPVSTDGYAIDDGDIYVDKDPPELFTSVRITYPADSTKEIYTEDTDKIPYLAHNLWYFAEHSEKPLTALSTAPNTIVTVSGKGLEYIVQLNDTECKIDARHADGSESHYCFSIDENVSDLLHHQFLYLRSPLTKRSKPDMITECVVEYSDPTCLNLQNVDPELMKTKGFATSLYWFLYEATFDTSLGTTYEVASIDALDDKEIMFKATFKEETDTTMVFTMSTDYTALWHTREETVVHQFNEKEQKLLLDFQYQEPTY